MTEQFFNMHNLNMIPVVLGGANYSAIAPAHSYINAADFPKLVQYKLDYGILLGRRQKYSIIEFPFYEVK